MTLSVSTTSYVVVAGVPTELYGVTIRDDSTEVSTLTVSFSAGSVSASAPSGGTAVVSSSKQSVTFTGNVDQIGAALETLLYTAAAAGTAIVQYVATSSQGGMISQSSSFTVDPSGTASPVPPGPGIIVVGPYATVTGATGELTLTFANATFATQVQGQLTAISNAISAGSAVAVSDSGGSLPSLGGNEPSAGLVEIDTLPSGGPIFTTLSAGYNTAIDLSSGPVSLIAAAAGNQLVIASGTGDLTYAAMSGAETVYGGSGDGLVFGGGASLDYFGGAGASTLIGGAAGNTISGGSGDQLIFGSSSLSYSGGTGAATIIGGANGNTVNGGVGGILAFASSSMTFVGGVGSATVIGGGGPLDAQLGTQGGLAYGGIAGNNTLSAGTVNSTLVGGGNGDVLTGGTSSVLVAGVGSETLLGGTGKTILFGGSGADVLTGGTGSNTFIAGSANETLNGGTGSNYLILNASPASARVDVIGVSDATPISVGLFGYGNATAAGAAALAAATTSNGSTTLSLSDGTQLVFSGIPNLHAYNFFGG